MAAKQSVSWTLCVDVAGRKDAAEVKRAAQM